MARCRMKMNLFLCECACGREKEREGVCACLWVFAVSTLCLVSALRVKRFILIKLWSENISASPPAVGQRQRRITPKKRPLLAAFAHIGGACKTRRMRVGILCETSICVKAQFKDCIALCRCLFFFNSLVVNVCGMV